MIDEMPRDRIEEISKSVLDDGSSEVATTISGYIAKKLRKRSKCEDCEKKLTVHGQDLKNDQYLTLLSRGGLFTPPKELAESVCSCFATLDFVEGDILSMGQVARSAMYVLKCCGPKCEFCCQYHPGWGVKFESKIVVNVYFNNKQKQAKDCVLKSSVESFNPNQAGLFQGCSRMGPKRPPSLPKICHTYPAMMKLGTVIPYPKKIQKIYESCDTPLDFC